MGKKDSRFYDWVEGQIVNDESSTDSEMRKHFMKEGPMTKREAGFYVNQRNRALKNPLKFKLKKFS